MTLRRQTYKTRNSPQQTSAHATQNVNGRSETTLWHQNAQKHSKQHKLHNESAINEQSQTDLFPGKILPRTDGAKNTIRLDRPRTGFACRCCIVCVCVSVRGFVESEPEK